MIFSKPQHTMSVSEMPLKKRKIMKEDGLKTELEKTIEALPADNMGKATYLLAVSKAPAVVSDECDPEQFLESEYGNVMAAAQRITAYWALRLVHFGQRTALRPLRQVEGCLEQHDASILASGFLCFVPSDVRGRTALYLDPLRLTKLAGNTKGTLSSAVRCSFYLLSCAIQEEKPIVLLVQDPPDNEATTYHDLLKQLFELIHCLPTRLDECIVLNYTESLGRAALYDNSKLARQVHKIKTRDSADIVKNLQQKGFSKDGLPSSAGGLWTYLNHRTWTTFRRDLEQELLLSKSNEVCDDSIRLLSAAGSNVSNMSASKSTQRLSATALEHERQLAKSLTKPANTIRIHNMKAKKQKLDIAYSRKRREREKQEEVDLKTKCAELTAANEALRSDEVNLQALIANARAVVTAIEHAVEGATRIQAGPESSIAFEPVPPPHVMMPYKTAPTGAPVLQAAPTQVEALNLVQRAAFDPHASRSEIAEAIRIVVEMVQGGGTTRQNPRTLHSLLFENYGTNLSTGVPVVQQMLVSPPVSVQHQTTDFNTPTQTLPQRLLASYRCSHQQTGLDSSPVSSGTTPQESETSRQTKLLVTSYWKAVHKHDRQQVSSPPHHAAGIGATAAIPPELLQRFLKAARSPGGR